MQKLVAVLAIIGLAACGKADQQKCDAGCRNYATVMFWDKADKEIAAAPAGEREALKLKKLAELASNIERGIDFCVSKCQSANNDEQADCLTAAKDAKAMLVCAPLED